MQNSHRKFNGKPFRNSLPSLCSRRAESLRRILVLGCLFCLLAACKRSAERTLEHAADEWDSGDYSAAAEEYEHYLERNPSGEQSLEARFKLANIYYFNLRRYEQARAHYSELLSQDSSSANAYLARERLAEALGELGRSYEAIAAYEDITPRDATERRRIRLRIADLYFDQKNYSQALTEYEKVIESAEYDEFSEQAYMREASIYNSRSQYELSLAVYRKLIAESRDPEAQMRATYGLADCHAGLYQFDEAIKTLRSIKEEREQAHIAERIEGLETQKREAARAKSSAPK
jgi:tetratricopeptide (TPR) repeat protein